MNIDTVIGIIVILSPLYFYWDIKRTKNWKTTSAKVIEIDPQSLFERFGNSYHLNTDSDYAIEYEVEGKKYIQTPDIESYVSIGGIKVYRKPIIDKEFMVRYEPGNPDNYSVTHAYSKNLISFITVVAITIGTLILTGSFSQ